MTETETIDKKTRNRIFSVLLAGTIISSLLQTSLTTALPAIMREFSVSASTGQWLTSAYSLAMGIMVPATAFLLRRFRTKYLFLTGMAFFVIGSLLAAYSPMFSVLLLGRILQAMGNGLSLSMTQVVILTIFPVEKRGSAMGIYGLAVGAAPVISPTITGIVIDLFNWRVIFWFAVIIMLIDIVFASFAMKNVLKTEKQPFDLVSMLLSAMGFSGLLLSLGNLGTDNFFSLNIGLPLLVGIVSLLAFILRQLRIKIPFLELRTFKNKEFRLSVIMSMFLYTVMIAGSVMFPIYIQTVHNLSATISGLILMPGSLAMAVISPLTGGIYDKFGIRKLAVIGSALLAISCISISFVNEETSVIYLAGTYIIRLIAIGCIMMPMATWGMSTMDSQFTSHGTALLTSLRTIAGAISSAVFVAVMTLATNMTRESADVTVNAYGVDVSFICISVIAVLQLLVAILFVGRQKK